MAADHEPGLWGGIAAALSAAALLLLRLVFGGRQHRHDDDGDMTARVAKLEERQAVISGDHKDLLDQFRKHVAASEGIHADVLSLKVLVPVMDGRLKRVEDRLDTIAEETADHVVRKLEERR